MALTVTARASRKRTANWPCSPPTLAGHSLALRVPDAVDVYDTGSGELVKSFPVEGRGRLEDLEHGIFVTAMGKSVTLRRLSGGRTVTNTRGIAHAQLEPAGLFVAGGRRVTFTPMSDVLHRIELGHA